MSIILRQVRVQFQQRPGVQGVLVQLLVIQVLQVVLIPV